VDRIVARREMRSTLVKVLQFCVGEVSEDAS